MYGVNEMLNAGVVPHISFTAGLLTSSPRSATYLGLEYVVCSFLITLPRTDGAAGPRAFSSASSIFEAADFWRRPTRHSMQSFIRKLEAQLRGQITRPFLYGPETECMQPEEHLNNLMI